MAFIFSCIGRSGRKEERKKDTSLTWWYQRSSFPDQLLWESLWSPGQNWHWASRSQTLSCDSPRKSWPLQARTEHRLEWNVKTVNSRGGVCLKNSPCEAGLWVFSSRQIVGSAAATLRCWCTVPGPRSCRYQWHDPSPQPADWACSSLSHFHCPGPVSCSPPSTRAPPDHSHNTCGRRTHTYSTYRVSMRVNTSEATTESVSDLSVTSGWTFFRAWRMKAGMGLAGVTQALVFRSEDFFSTLP